MGLFSETWNCGLRMCRECHERFPRHRGLAIPTCNTSCVTHMQWCMPWSLTSGFFWSRWRGKRSRHSRRMGNPQFYVSGKRPMPTEKVQMSEQHSNGVELKADLPAHYLPKSRVSPIPEWFLTASLSHMIGYSWYMKELKEPFSNLVAGANFSKLIKERGAVWEMNWK